MQTYEVSRIPYFSTSSGTVETSELLDLRHLSGMCYNDRMYDENRLQTCKILRILSNVIGMRPMVF